MMRCWFVQRFNNLDFGFAPCFVRVTQNITPEKSLILAHGA
jgi:hypothetical protein